MVDEQVFARRRLDGRSVPRASPCLVGADHRIRRISCPRPEQMIGSSHPFGITAFHPAASVARIEEIEVFPMPQHVGSLDHSTFPARRLIHQQRRPLAGQMEEIRCQWLRPDRCCLRSELPSSFHIRNGRPCSSRANAGSIEPSCSHTIGPWSI